jgi:hypothetical protein
VNENYRRNTDIELAYDSGEGTRGAVAKMQDWSSMAQGAFSANTIRAWRADWEVFIESCRVYRLESLPASPKTVRAFVFECLGKGKKPATCGDMCRLGGRIGFLALRIRQIQKMRSLA